MHWIKEQASKFVVYCQLSPNLWSLGQYINAFESELKLSFLLSDLVSYYTWLKNSWRRHSSHGSATSIGRHSFEMSATFNNIIKSWERKIGKKTNHKKPKIKKKTSKEKKLHVSVRNE